MSAVQRDSAKTFVDLYAGCGGLSFGLMRAGWNGLFAIEHDKNAFQTLQHNLLDGTSTNTFSWPEWLDKSPHRIEDVLKNHPASLLALRDRVDLVVGGPPCQGFSMAGRRDANDPRNRLTESYLDFVRIVNPKVVLIENVRGMTLDFKDDTSEDGKVNYAKWIIESLSQSYSVTAKMLDTSQFGVPQKRLRYFIIGIRKDIENELIGNPFEAIERDRLGFLSSKGLTLPVSAKAAISDLELGRNGSSTSTDNKNFNQINYGGAITAYQRLMNGGLEIVSDTRMARHSADIATRFQKIIDTCNADGRLNVSLSAEFKAALGLKKRAIRVMDPDRPSPTITSLPDDLIHYSEPRALTVRENARLQSFPDHFAFKGKYTSGGNRRVREVPRFTQVANAVPPLVAEALGRSIIKYLSTSSIVHSAPPTPKQAPQKGRAASTVLI